MEAKSVLEMARGAILERADYEMAKILSNIRDPNTDVKPARELHIVLKFTTDADRQNIYMSCVPKPPKLAPTNPITTSLYVTNDEAGGMAVVELTPQIPGQLNLDGEEQEAPYKLRIVGGNN